MKWLLIIFLTGAQPQVIPMDDKLSCLSTIVAINEAFRGRINDYNLVCQPVLPP